VDHWNQVEDPDINLHIFDKEVRIIQLKREIILNKWCSSKWTSASRRKQRDPYLYPLHKTQVQADQKPQHKGKKNKKRKKERKKERKEGRKEGRKKERKKGRKKERKEERKKRSLMI